MKYSGSFFKGLAGGLKTGLNYGMNAAQIRWQIEQKKKLETEKEKMQEAWTNFSQSAQEIYEGGGISQETERKLYALMFTLPPELQASAKNLLAGVNQNNKAAVEKEFENLQMVIDVLESTGGRVTDEALDGLINILSPENQQKITAVMEAYKSVPGQPTTEVFPTAGAVMETYPEAGYKYTKEGYVPEFQKPAPKKAPTVMEQEIAGIDNLEKAGVISKKQADQSRLKIYGGVLPEKPTAGVSTKEPTPPVPTTTENTRDDILEADTLEDAQRIHKNYVAKYGEKTLDMPDVDKYWSDGQMNYLSGIKRALDTIVDEKGRLKKGTLTQEEVGIEFKGEQKVEEIYEMLREEYMKYRDMLEKMGIDISKYPELLTFEEYSKMDIKPWALFSPSTWGKQKSSIYK
ncbi:MAG: hypothetical protein KAW56_16750 [Candidatus Marinimicrobia bacterium]|nr:hypothetical protein [Candidatus Neomarinimicrobiota bacterium]